MSDIAWCSVIKWNIATQLKNLCSMTQSSDMKLDEAKCNRVELSSMKWNSITQGNITLTLKKE